jgi:putative (di)nucleoside polyphosphate hydrolase
MVEKPFRQAVVGVFINKDGKILLGERSDAPGAWQLPQGGVDESESEDVAIRREMREELGITRFDILKRAAEKCTYEFPSNLISQVSKCYRGQEQQWYLLRLPEGENPDIDLADGEFCNFEWRDITSAIEGIIEWKRQCYRKGFHLLGLTDSVENK